MSNRFERRTARNTRSLVRLAAWEAERNERVRQVLLARALRRAEVEVRVIAIPPRPDLDP